MLYVHIVITWKSILTLPDGFSGGHFITMIKIEIEINTYYKCHVNCRYIQASLP